MFRTLPLRRLLTVLAVLAAVAIALPVHAQSTGMVKGKVMDAANQPVEGAKVVIEFADGMNRKYEVKSNKKGEFIQIGLQPGNYKLVASKDGVGQQGFDAVRVRLGTPTEVNFVLTPAGPGGAPMTKEDVEFRKLFQEGVSALTANDYDGALAKFQQTVTQRSDCFQCHLGLGEAYRGKNDYANAEAEFKKAAEMKPDAPEPYRAMRDMYNMQKKFDEAAKMAEEANKRGGGAAAGGSASDLYNQAATFWNAGKFDEAKASLDQALNLDANHADSHFLMGKVLVNQGKLEEALTHLDNYLQFAPNGQNAAEAKTLADALRATLKK